MKNLLRKNFLVLLVVLFFLLGLCCFYFFRFQTPLKPHQLTTSAPELSLKEYKTERDKYIFLLMKQNPHIALNTLREETKTNNALARSCHALTHELGFAAYTKYKNFATAMKYQDDVCNSGYLHGIIESYFSNTNDIFTTMKTICSNYSPTSFIGWECYHGIGHGLMYFTGNALPWSLSLCHSYTDRTMRSACVNGVFMENFNTDQKLHPSRYLKSNDPLYPCQKQITEDKDTCYLYAPTYYLSLHKNEYQQTIVWCKKAEDSYRQTCITGVGGQMMKENSNNPTFVEKTCMNANQSGKDSCIAGMVGLYINHVGNITEAKTLCPKLKKENQAICEQVIFSEQGM